MVHLTLSDEDARLITESSSPVIFVDRSGRRLGQLAPLDSAAAFPRSFSDDEIAEMKRRSREPGNYSTLQEIKQRLEARES